MFYTLGFKKTWIWLGLTLFMGCYPLPAESGDFQNRQVIDLIEMAPQATWKLNDLSVPWGKDQFLLSFADYEYNVKGLADGKAHARTLYMPFPGTRGFALRGFFRLKLLKAEKITMTCEATGVKHWAGPELAIGYLLPGSKKTEYLCEKDITSHLSKPNSPPVKLEADLTFLAGKEVDIVFKNAPKKWSVPGRIYWITAQIECTFPQDNNFDLALSPADIKVVSQESPDKIGLFIRIHNIGPQDSSPFTLTMKAVANGGELSKVVCPAIKALGYFETNVVYTPKSAGKQDLDLAIESAGAETNTANNTCRIAVQTPCYGLYIKRIEGYPRPWQADELGIYFENTLENADHYRLSYTITDFWGQELLNKDVALPKTAGFKSVTVDLKDFVTNRLGWFQANFTLSYLDKPADSQRVYFSRIPPRAKVLNPFININVSQDIMAEYQLKTDLKGQVYSALEMIRDVGPRYVRPMPGLPLSTPDYLSGFMHALKENGQAGYISIETHGIVDVAQNISTQTLARLSEETFRFVSYHKKEGTGKIYELGNEFNGEVSAAQCAEVYKCIYTAAKRADPDCVVNSVGLGESPGKWPWLEELYRLAGPYIDNISLHSYTRISSPVDRDMHLFKTCAQPIDQAINILKKYGDYPQKTVYETEYAWATWDEQSMIYHAQVSVRQFLLGIAHNVPMFQFIAWDPAYLCGEEDENLTGLVLYNYEPKPGLVSFAILSSRLGGAKFVEEKQIGHNNYLYLFEKEGRKFACIWKSDGPDESITVPAASREVTITDLMGMSRSVTSKNGLVTIPLSTSVVYVEGIDFNNFKVAGIQSVEKGKLEANAGYQWLNKTAEETQDPRWWVYVNFCQKTWRDSADDRKINQIVAKAKDAIGNAPEQIVPERTIDCPQTRVGPIKIDGNLTDWQGYKPIMVRGLAQREFGKTVTGPGIEVFLGKIRDDQDLSFDFYNAWDKNYLYLAFDVTDNDVRNKQPGRLVFTEDCVELWLSAANNHRPNLQPGDYQYVFGVNGNSFDTVRQKENATATIWQVKRSEKGYIMELALPWSEIMLSHLAPGYVMGFDFGIDDVDDNETERHCQVLYFGKGDNACKPSNWGYLRLTKGVSK